MKADNWEGHKEVFKHSVLPIIADESCIIEEDVAKCHNHFHGINIKLVKCGGLTPARRMIQEAKKRFKNNGRVHDRIVCGDFSYCIYYHNWIMLIWMAPCYCGRYSNGVTIKNGKVSYSERNGTGVLFYKHS
jgi:L-alanine-DL-glutamate epimerase-like enolase superfamily enzyme